MILPLKFSIKYYIFQIKNSSETSYIYIQFSNSEKAMKNKLSILFFSPSTIFTLFPVKDFPQFPKLSASKDFSHLLILTNVHGFFCTFLIHQYPIYSLTMLFLHPKQYYQSTNTRNKQKKTLPKKPTPSG